MLTQLQLDDFTLSYIEAALWSSYDESKPLDANYSIEDIAPETLDRMIEDCQHFQRENAADLARYAPSHWTADEMGGHDFFLTRNHHGAGFWDGDWPEAIGKRLTEASHAYGEFDLYVGDDGLIYS
jgi:hypothetical protein